MKTQHVVALAISAVVVVWMLVPRSSDGTSDDTNMSSGETVVVLPADESITDENADFTVRASTLDARTYVERIRIRGRTQAIRTVEVRAEQSGRIAATPVQRGSRVSQGDILCEIALDNREAELQEALSRQEQAELEYQAALDLQARGLQSQVNIAQNKAARDAAAAAVDRARLALENTRIRAPFDGVMETRPVDIGDLLERGGVCATVMDDTPMLLVGLVSEQEIGKVRQGAKASSELLTGERVSGEVTYLSRSADPVSRSYRIEVELETDGVIIRDGITSEILVDAEEVEAHLIPASALTLNDAGQIGVKILDNTNTVGFATINIIGDETNQLNPGIWVTGLPEQVNLITHGQEIVFPGQQVQSDYNWSTGNR
ncbi:MAG: efflux RND transporter periplasmic adaptor subunit [Pseudohongiellaceae bacterium]